MTRKFVFGLPPVNPDFNREAEGWRRLKEPSPVVSCWLIGLPLAIVLGFLFYEMASRWAGFSIDQMFEQSTLASLLAIWVVLIIVHEFLHGLIHPGLGLSPHTFFGFSLKTGAFWAHYTESMSRERMLLLLITPFMVLSVITLLIASLVPPVAMTAGFVAILNAAFSAVDLFGSIMIMVSIPAGATVQNNGWSTYWKLLGASLPMNKAVGPIKRTDKAGSSFPSSVDGGTRRHNACHIGKPPFAQQRQSDPTPKCKV